ncbi:hypothetical protein Hanom_Chr16g01477991 [Helianthus anomalus]
MHLHLYISPSLSISNIHILFSLSRFFFRFFLFSHFRSHKTEVIRAVIPIVRCCFKIRVRVRVF